MRLRAACIALCLVLGVDGPAGAEHRITVHGTVRRVDSHALVPGATVYIKANAMVGARVLGQVVTDGNGAFTADVTVEHPRFTCEATAPGMASQQVSLPTDTPTCEFELESELQLSDLVTRSLTTGGAAALTFLAHTDSSLLLAGMTIRLHVRKPDVCGASGAVQQYEVGGTLQVSLDHVAGKLSTGPSTLVLTGKAPLWRCEATTISLHVAPAEALPAGATPIRIALPASLTLKLDTAVASLSLAQGSPSAAYRSTIDRVDVDLVTSRDGKASVSSQDISIPVQVARYPVRPR